ncbi:hypothetical protein MHU86_18769 [Fragilaria crotonensis]|nr:hypothetical protein MHU86_18769 [Fragilaria crotonensis]
MRRTSQQVQDEMIATADPVYLVNRKKAIHIPDIAPNDVILVNNIPRFLTENGNDLTHSLLVIPTADDTSTPYVSPLSVRGVTLTFRTRQSPIEAYGTLLMLRSRAKISRGTL